MTMYDINRLARTFRNCIVCIKYVITPYPSETKEKPCHNQSDVVHPRCNWRQKREHCTSEGADEHHVSRAPPLRRHPAHQ